MAARRQSKRPSATASLEHRIADVGSGLARAFTGVLKALPGAPHRPQFLAQSLGVNTVLTSRLLKAAQQPDPMVVAHTMPGPEPLRRLLRAAARKKIDPALIEQARAAVDRFQELIDAEAGDRSALDAIISGWLPDARQRVELIAKQSMFRGISQLLGCACHCEHCSTILYPAKEDGRSVGRADALSIVATQGLRRVRPGLPVIYDTVHAKTPMFTITGEPVEDLHGLLLEEFCSKPLPKLDVMRFDDFVQYTLSGDDVGVRSAVNLAHATFLPRHKPLHGAPGEAPQWIEMAYGVGTPVRTYIVDVLLHDDVYPGQTPSLSLYRTVGVFKGGNAAGRRDVDRLDVIESLESLGHGLSKFRSPDTPGYQDMIRHVCEQRRWDAGKLRGYRCRVEYPIYSSEIVLNFDLPQNAG